MKTIFVYIFIAPIQDIFQTNLLASAKMILNNRFMGMLKMILLVGTFCIFAFLFHLFCKGSFDEGLLDF